MYMTTTSAKAFEVLRSMCDLEVALGGCGDGSERFPNHPEWVAMEAERKRLRALELSEAEAACEAALNAWLEAREDLMQLRAGATRLAAIEAAEAEYDSASDDFFNLAPCGADYSAEEAEEIRRRFEAASVALEAVLCM